MTEERASYVVNDMYKNGFELAKTKKVKTLPETEEQAAEWYKGYLAGMHERNEEKWKLILNAKQDGS